MLTHSFVDSAWLFPVHMSAAWQVQLERELERTQNEHVVRPQPPRPSITHACARGGRDGDRAAVTVSAAFSFDMPPPAAPHPALNWSTPVARVITPIVCWCVSFDLKSLLSSCIFFMAAPPQKKGQKALFHGSVVFIRESR